MELTKESLEEQLKSSQLDVENSRITLHRAEGMVLLLQHLIGLCDAPEPEPAKE